MATKFLINRDLLVEIDLTTDPVEGYVYVTYEGNNEGDNRMVFYSLDSGDLFYVPTKNISTSTPPIILFGDPETYTVDSVDSGGEQMVEIFEIPQQIQYEDEINEIKDWLAQQETS